ncbi:MAG: uracil-DNA glycosylase [Gemmataceae bacterium]
MSEPIATMEELRRQLEAHLRTLRSAGVEWAPQGPRIQAKVVAVASVPESVSVGSTPSDSEVPHVQMEETDNRRQELSVLAAEVAKCVRCPSLASTRTQTVFSDGDPYAELLFVGEAPGADEDAQGKPFVGAAGQLLNKIIAACGLKREDVFICNVLKCRPPGNRTPLPDEADNCKGYLERQIELVKPKFIVCFGSSAATHLLGTNKSLGQMRGRFHDYKGTPVMVTYHPAYLLPHRSPEKKRDVWEDMKMLMAKLGRPIPEKGSASSE